MKEDWLDKNLEDKFDGYESPMDLEKTWDAIQVRRQEPKKKNRFFYSLGKISQLENHIVSITNSTKREHQSLARKNSKTKNRVSISNVESTSTNNLNNNDKIIFAKNTYLKSNSPISYFSKNKNQKPRTNLEFPLVGKKEIESQTNGNHIQNTILPIATLPTLKKKYLKSTNANTQGFAFSTNFEMENKTACEVFKIGCIPPPNYLTIYTGYGIRSTGKIFQEENPLDAISLGILFEKRFMKSKFYLKSGINFDQFVNSVEKSSELISVQSSDNQLILINQYQDGTTEEIYGMGEFTQIEKTTSKEFNRYQLVSVPLILGYDLYSNKKLTLQIEGGTARSIYTNYSGKIFDLADIDLEKKGVWQGLYGLNVNYRFQDGFQIFSSLKGNQHFNTFGKSSNLQIQKFRFHQTQIGLRIRL